MSIDFSKNMKKIMDLVERINYIPKNNKIKPGVSEYEFAKSLGTYPSKFSEIRSGKVKTLSQDIALEISKIYNVEFMWLLTGEGNIFKTQMLQATYQIPIRGEVEASCGYGVTVYEENVKSTYSISKKFADDLGINPQKSEIIFARGDSMEPTIFGGDSLLVDLSKKEIYDGSIYCVRIDGQLYTKRLQKIPPSIVFVVSDNNKYRSFDIDFSKKIDFDFEVIGEVRWWGRIAK